ncbi:MAG: hypothetical protein D6160_00335 [Ketobacter sp.]|nr:MAG: hypothetical protein D6160_00335 [Ketobacter sp.]
MEMEAYCECMQERIDTYASYFTDDDGNLTPEGKAFLYDEALNTHSVAEGPTVMLPGGMVDLPAALGVMGGASYTPPGSRFTFATNVYAPMMNGVHRAADDPGRYAQERVAFTVITYFSPSMAYEVSDELSVGLSVNFNYSGMGMELPIREPHLAFFFLQNPWVVDNFCNGNRGGNDPTIPELNICSTVLSPYEELTSLQFEVDQPDAIGYNFGLLWSPRPWVTFGFAYNSRILASMDGEFNFPVADNFKQFLVTAMSGGVYTAAVGAVGSIVDLPTAEEIQNGSKGKLNVTYELPQRLNFGVSLQITPKWKTNVDVRWTEWSAFSDINLNFSEDSGLLKWGALADAVGNGGANGISGNAVKYRLGLQDVTYWGMGMEYQYSDRLALRAGFESRPGAVPKDRPNAFIPINDGDLYSAGFGYDMEGDNHFDVGFGYFRSKTHYPPCSAVVGNGCDPNQVVYPPYSGQDLTTDVTFFLVEVMYQKHF